MNRMCWWLAERVSRALEPEEREAVRGDFAESGESGVRALVGTVGLVARRQVLLWKDWRPWLALVGLLGPVGFLLSVRAFGLSLSLAIPLWASLHYGQGYPAMTMTEGILFWTADLILVPVFAWTAGLALLSLSRRTAWVHGTLFVLWCLYCNTRVAHYLLTQQFVFTLTFEALLFFCPVTFGVRRGLGSRFVGVRSAFLLLIATGSAIVILLVAVNHVLIRIAQSARAGVWLPNPLVGQSQFVPLAVMSWPLVYLAVAAVRARRTPALR